MWHYLMLPTVWIAAKAYWTAGKCVNAEILLECMIQMLREKPGKIC